MGHPACTSAQDSAARRSVSSGLVIVVVGGRLWFVADGQRLDVTERVDDETPYVHTTVDEAGNLHYWIVGGTPEDYGWFEGVKLPDGTGGGGAAANPLPPERHTGA